MILSKNNLVKGLHWVVAILMMLPNEVIFDIWDYCSAYVWCRPEKYMLRGTYDSRLLGRITGLERIDRILNCIIVVYWECVSGNDPTLSIVFAYYLGQSLPLVVGVFLDGQKIGKEGNWMYKYVVCVIERTLWLRTCTNR